MPSIDYNFIKKVKESYPNDNTFPIFLETGTLIGDTVISMNEYFDELHTIEVSKYYYYLSKKRGKDTKVHFHLGDSSEKLKEILPTLEKNTVFWLDGHYSSGNTGKGKKDCPLLEEIELINNHFKHKAILMIDDYRLFGTNFDEDWREITKENVISKIKDRIINTYHLPSKMRNDDRLIINIKEK